MREVRRRDERQPREPHRQHGARGGADVCREARSHEHDAQPIEPSFRLARIVSRGWRRGCRSIGNRCSSAPSSTKPRLS